MPRPWLPFYPADYLADTRDLDVAEHGAYVLLLIQPAPETEAVVTLKLTVPVSVARRMLLLVP